MKRTEFIKSACTACALFAIPGMSAILLESCASLPSFTTVADSEKKQCAIPVEKFAGSNLLLLRIKKSDFDFVVIKRADNTYNTLQLKCTHEDQPLGVTSKNIYCSSHGSVFDFEGNATKEPASRPLKSFKTNLVENQVIINF